MTLEVTEERVADRGDDDPANLTRLRWLNSQLAADDSVVAPYTPLVVRGRTVALLGRELTFGADGLPASIRSYFTPEQHRHRPRRARGAGRAGAAGGRGRGGARAAVAGAGCRGDAAGAGRGGVAGGADRGGGADDHRRAARVRRDGGVRHRAPGHRPHHPWARCGWSCRSGPRRRST
ncbi:MAG: hypothetical protein IPG75_21860 [Gemmatimonadetes bacterium]|nr:hypothetical protein [Gemmatimonadota bacterium]